MVLDLTVSSVLYVLSGIVLGYIGIHVHVVSVVISMMLITY